MAVDKIKASSVSDFTVGELKLHLNGYPDDTKLTFAGGLTFYRLKQWGNDAVFLDFNEAQADLTPSFRKKNPTVKVAFISMDGVTFDDS